jgi:hypothetical protein
MSFRVVHTYALPGVDHGDALLKSLDAMLVKGVMFHSSNFGMLTYTLHTTRESPCQIL